MYILISWLLLGGFLALLIVPWIRLSRMRKEINRLREQVTWLISYAQTKGAIPPEKWEKPAQVPLKQPEYKYIVKEPTKEPPSKKLQQPPDFISKPVPSQNRWKDIKKSFEQKYVLSLPVWIGGIALALAGAFMVKYSIEMGFLSPSVRIAIGCLFGICLLLFGNWIHDRSDIANGDRIAQALSGAGIADLYICLFAATSLYHLMPPLFGFLGMAGVTAIAVVLSLKQGPPIAILGMIGGFLTPALIESKDPNAQFLFIYLYFVFFGLFTIIRKKNWWFISIPAVLFSFFWVIFWLESNYASSDSFWLGVFLIAMSATTVFHSKQAIEENIVKKSYALKLNSLSIGGAFLLMSIVAAKSHFGEMEWGLFGFLTAGGIVLAYYNQKLYGFIPPLSLLMNVLLLGIWQAPNASIFTTTLLLFALLYTTSSYWLMWKSLKPVQWGLLTATSSLIYYILAYAKLHNWIEKSLVPSQDWYTNPHLWGLLALGLFLVFCGGVLQILNRFQGEEDVKQRLLTIFTLTTTAFLSIGLALELTEGFLTIALSAEILAISWMNRYVQIKALRLIVGLLSILFGILLVPQLLFQIALLSNLFLENYLELKKTAVNLYSHNELSYLQSKIPSINWSFFHLGLPALMFGASSFWLRQQKDDFLIKAFEMIAIGLISILTYYLIRHVFHINENLLFASSTFIERATLTNIFFLYGLACLWWGREYKQSGVLLSGAILIGLCLSRILLFDLLLYNPLWTHQQVGSLPFLNVFLVSFGLPIVWLTLINKQLIKIGEQKDTLYVNICLFILLFFFMNFNVRQLFHGEYLDSAITTNAEIYSYSVAWLLTGIGLLFFGTLWQNKTLRIASLVFMTLTIGKAFLYDASELTGLLRVFSFFGLGVGLLGLSWFYTRFVFKRLP